ncbi:MAG TPA: cell division topological specificity factor MinE [Anaerolineaceae bacterium]|nr:cell division topological specificity factor MinE [Anaerolineaceae bacterium]
MDNFLEKLFGKDKKSANTAKERLKLVLIHDRTDITPGQLDSLKNELIDVISRYIKIEPNKVKINMTQDGKEHRLIADIPITSSTRKK